MGLNAIWDEAPVDVTAEANFIWSIANKLRGSYMPDKYGDVIIPMVIIRRFSVHWKRQNRLLLICLKRCRHIHTKPCVRFPDFSFTILASLI